MRFSVNVLWMPLMMTFGVFATELVADDAGDRKALTALAVATNYTRWTKSSKWMKDDKSVCEWHGINCTNGRVTAIVLKQNGLDGALPLELALLTELETFDVSGGRPDNYQGCGKNNLYNSSLEHVFGLTKLRDVNVEYACLGGTLEGIGSMRAIESFQAHGNFITGTIPQEINQLVNVVILKLGRNPITGTLPLFTDLKKVVQFNCNFCALTGTFPEMFGHMPSLQVSYWDGNGFHGSLPTSIGLAKQLKRLSFNVNNFTGPIPESICGIPAGQKGGDCRIGADTELGPYQAFYPWILPVRGNYYDCSHGVPSCAHSGASCNTTSMYPSKAQNYSVVRCSPEGSSITLV